MIRASIGTIKNNLVALKMLVEKELELIETTGKVSDYFYDDLEYYFKLLRLKLERD